MLKAKVVEKIKTRILFFVTIFFFPRLVTFMR